MIKNIKKVFINQRGFVVTIITFLILITMTTIVIGMSSLVFYRQRTASDSIKSIQSYYAAEAGAEDALLRLKNDPQMNSLSYSLNAGDVSATVVIPTIVGGSRTITTQGNIGGIVRGAQVVYVIDSQKVSFRYGAQVGEGGLQMSNGSRVEGNVFSNGNIVGSGIIDNDAIVAGNGNKIEGMHIKGNAMAYSCVNSTIDGNLNYVVGGTNSCIVGGDTMAQSNSIEFQSLPISQGQIDQWKIDAAEGGIISESIVVANGQTRVIGPVKIIGSLTVSNNATLKMTGTVYVTGNIVLSNNSTVMLDSLYGALGGVILSDGNISASNNTTLMGSGQSSSYLLVLSTSPSSAAISISNNAVGAIFYTSAGEIFISNNVRVKELTGYKITLSNNAVIQYESGLANILFSTGPGGAWRVANWEEK